MTAVAETSLSGPERALVERFVEELRVALGSQLQAVWLFGSRRAASNRRRSQTWTSWSLWTTPHGTAGCSYEDCWTTPPTTSASTL